MCVTGSDKVRCRKPARLHRRRRRLATYAMSLIRPFPQGELEPEAPERVGLAAVAASEPSSRCTSTVAGEGVAAASCPSNTNPGSLLGELEVDRAGHLPERSPIARASTPDRVIASHSESRRRIRQQLGELCV